MHSRIKRAASLSAALLAALICVAAWQRHQELRTAHTKSLFAMDTFFTLTAYGPGAKEALEQCAVRAEELEARLSVTKQDSDIGRMDVGRNPVGADTLTLVKAALELGEETGGALDITLYPILREWGFTTGNYRVPGEERLQALLAHVDYTRVEVDEASSTVFLPEDVELDLGAVAKGYTGDCLLALLRERGVTSAMLDLGGNIQTLGTKPDGSLWRIAVKDPFDTGAVLGVLETADKAVVTSGSYERYFIGEDGRVYGHILDPADGYPADNGLASVTVVGQTGLRCDGLSTALFIMGREEAVDFWRNRRDFEMLLVAEDGELYLTEGLADCFVCNEDRHVKIVEGK